MGDPQAPRDLGTSSYGVLPGFVGGPLKAHTCPRRVRWSRLEALIGLPRVMPNEPRECKTGKEMKV